MEFKQKEEKETNMYIQLQERQLFNGFAHRCCLPVV